MEGPSFGGLSQLRFFIRRPSPLKALHSEAILLKVLHSKAIPNEGPSFGAIQIKGSSFGGHPH